MARCKQIGPASHQRHPICRIIERGGEMVAGRSFFSEQHDIAKDLRNGLLAPGARIHPFKLTGKRQRFPHIKPPGRPFGIGISLAASTWIDRPARPSVLCGSQHLGAGAMAGINQPHLLQPLACSGIAGEAAGLEYHVAVPAQPKPFQIGENFGNQLGPAADPVDILDP